MDDASIRCAYKVNDILDFGCQGQVLLDFLDTLCQDALAVEQAISVMNLADGLVRESPAA